ncbi:thiopeptide-type bacteriocin biosynthesis protein [Bacillus subtilis]|nr:thiopeptide-type bacteriocin biosynthesis protein [Bacillus subtilis]MDM5302500.1 thiopeptide-type bacteriocin biosynthesis protein [Bacillus subtilis]MDM5324553.1 thiopeptide-type bacteriocin biosynthesis protein [Bacillus subtilis]
MKWHSYHIFIHDMTFHDRFLNNFLNRFIKKNQHHIKRFFFIRYWQGGPHIRFRFQSDDPNDIIQGLENVFEEFKVDYKPNYRLTKEEFYSSHSFDGQKPDDLELYWFDDLSIKNIPYQPEFERYGGQEIMTYSENIFYQTSKLALEKITESNGNLPVAVRLMLACDFFQSMKEYITKEEYEKLLTHYDQFWSRFNQGVRVNTDQVKKFSKLYWQKKELNHDPFPESAAEVYDELKWNIDKIVRSGHRKMLPYYIFSYIHMFNNRIGLPPYLESSVAVILNMNADRR